MKIFTVYSKNTKNLTNKIAFVEEGFSLSAFIFNLIWVLYKRIWWLATILIVTNVTLIMIQNLQLINNYYIYIIHIFIYFGLGLYGNDFYRFKLKLDGYQLVDIIAGKDIDFAEFSFFKKIEKISLSN